MRTPKRLKFLYKFFKSKKKFKLYLRDIVKLQSENEMNYWSETFFSSFQNIKKFHLANPHLRFPQVLQYFGLYQTGFFFYFEDDMVLLDLGANPREVLYWGQNYSASGKRLKNTKWLLIKDMDINHIKAILEGNFTSNLSYLKAFNNELKLRENETNFN